MTELQLIRVGSRKSPLAVAQTKLVCHAITKAFPHIKTQLVTMETRGDRFLNQNLYEIGGKGLFTHEIESALISGDIDLAIHSLKDLPAEFPEALHIGATFKRHSPFDLFLSYHYDTIEALPKGAKVGTSSPRRAAQLRRLRPDIVIVPFRGNIQTRLQKLADGVADATFLAEAGFERMALQTPGLYCTPMSPTTMLPAVGQGTLALQTRRKDPIMNPIITALNDHDTALCTQAERAFLEAFEGSCRTPIAALAQCTETAISLQCQILSFDGTRTMESTTVAPHHQAHQLGQQAAADFLKQIDTDFFGQEPE